VAVGAEAPTTGTNEIHQIALQEVQEMTILTSMEPGKTNVDMAWLDTATHGMHVDSLEQRTMRCMH